MPDMNNSPHPPTDDKRLTLYEEALRDASRQLEEKVQELSLLRRIADISGHIYDLNIFSKSFIDILLEETYAMNCSLLLKTQDEQRFYLKAARGRSDDGSFYDSDIHTETTFDIGQGIAGRAALLKETLLVKDATEDTRFELRYTRTPIGSLLCAPLLFNDTVLGVVNLSHHEKNYFTENTKRLMHIACGMAAEIIGNALTHLRNEQRFRAMFEGVPFAIIIFDSEDDTIIDCNQFTEQCFGFTKQELLAFKNIEALCAPGEEEKIKRVHETQNEKKVHEISFRKKNGELSICEVTANHLVFEGRSVVRLSAIDISSKKEFERKLYQAEKLKSLGELASGVAHDINNMLAAIMGRVELVRKNIALLKQDPHSNAVELIERHIDIIEKAAHDGADMVHRIQRFSRVHDEKEMYQVVNLAEIINDALELTRGRCKDHDVQFGCTTDITASLGSLRPVYGNAAELREVFVNLINNALDAMPNGGKLTIAAATENDTVRISVSDTGIGIPEEIRDRIFDPFFTTKDIGSTGLGLSISYSIIQRHKGTLTVESNTGNGSSFIITLPVATSTRTEPKERDLPAFDVRKKILVIDDDAHVSETLAEMLAYAGHSVACAHSGIEGLEKFSADTYDIVFTDLGMPGLDGFEVAQRIKEQKPQQTVILITGWSLSLDSEQLRARGVDFIITKPFQLKQVLFVIDHALTPTSSRLP